MSEEHTHNWRYESVTPTVARCTVEGCDAREPEAAGDTSALESRVTALEAFRSKLESEFTQSGG